MKIEKNNLSAIPICIKCIYYEIDTPGQTCKAFPKGIPEEILTGEFDHAKNNYPGDNGIKFKEWKGDKNEST